MAAPEYVPVKVTDQPARYESPDHVPDPWTADRPGDLDALRQPEGRYHGDIGPDQGYALVLAKRFHDRLRLAEHEHAEDVVAGCVAVAMRRASMFRRAPVIHDLDIAFTVWGYLDRRPPPTSSTFAGRSSSRCRCRSTTSASTRSRRSARADVADGA